MDKCELCQQPADKVCTGCRSVSYCSVEHQKIQWKQHKKSCRAWLVKKNDILGRYVVATRDLPAGTIIMNEEALAVGPKQETSPICLGCHKRVFNNSYTCSKCRFPMCSSECEKIPIHANNECKIFQKEKLPFKFTDFDNPHPAYECILAIRCLMLKELNPGKYKRLTTMEHHNDLRKQNLVLWKRNENNTVSLLRERFHMTEWDSMTIHTALGYADINAFEIRREGIEICGIFPDVALMAHQCISNTSHSITDDDKMKVRTAVPLKKNNMITTTYTHTLYGTLERRKYIAESKLFECICPRCEDPTEGSTYFSAIKCQRIDCPKGYILPKFPLNPNSFWNCDLCNATLEPTTVEKMVEKLRNEIRQIRKEGGDLVEKLENFLTKYSGILVHPNHFIMIDVIHSLSEIYGRLDGYGMNELSIPQLERKIEVCQHLLNVLDVLEPGLSRIRGTTIYELHAPLYFLTKNQLNNGQLKHEEVNEKLQQVIKLLKEANKILEFDSLSSREGKIALVIPESIAGVEEVLTHFKSNVKV